MEALNAYSPQPVAEDAQKLAYMLRKDKDCLARFDSIVYETKEKGANSTCHRFVTKDALVKAMEKLGIKVEDI